MKNARVTKLNLRSWLNRQTEKTIYYMYVKIWNSDKNSLADEI